VGENSGGEIVIIMIVRMIVMRIVIRISNEMAEEEHPSFVSGPDSPHQHFFAGIMRAPYPAI